MLTRRIAFFSFLALIVGLGSAGPVAQSQPSQGGSSEEPSWTWPESRWRDAVEKVRSGRRLLPESWPDGAKVAVTLSFDFDNETLSLRNGIRRPRGCRRESTARGRHFPGF